MKALKNPKKEEKKPEVENQFVYTNLEEQMKSLIGTKVSVHAKANGKRGLSAGRVQSVALRMICDREDEINAFIPEEYWNLDAMLNVAGSKKPLDAKYYGLANEKIIAIRPPAITSAPIPVTPSFPLKSQVN